MLTTACASTSQQPPDSLSAKVDEARAAVTTTNIVTESAVDAVPPRISEQEPALAKPDKQDKPETKTRIFPGNDQLFKRDIGPQADPVLARGEKVSLNFENITVGNLAVALLGDLLKLSYTVDAGGDTVVSLRTSQPLARNQVLDVLDAVLLPHDLAIVRDNAGVYHVTKRTVTVGARPVVGSARFKDLAGAGTVIVPLNYVAAGEMAKILAPIAPREAIVYVDTLRNLLVLQGSKAQLGGWLEMVDAFDVDFLSGMSLGVFVLENANVNVVRDALQAMLGPDKSADSYGGSGAANASPFGAALANVTAAAGGSAAPAAAAGGANALGAAATNPLFGLIRVFPVERLNALVVVTPRAQLLSQVETWIRRLDQPSDALEAGVFVYPVQNGSAEHLAAMLNGLFGNDSTQSKGGVAAGSAPSQFSAATGGSVFGGSTGTSGLGTGTAGTGLGIGASTASGAAGMSSLRPMTANGGTNPSAPTTSELEGNVRVVADDKSNALLIRAPRAEYRRIEKALRELDKAPVQVLIEASIVEVSLTGNLAYGVEWYVQNGLSNEREGIATLNSRLSGGIGAKQPGFSYTIVNKAGLVRATLNALAAKSQLRVLSNPSVLVLNNHNATIQIGKQQPVKSSTTVTTGNLITEAITYKDTGVMLSVTPSVNSGGLITMDIAQQVTDVGEIDDATKQRSFLTRQIQSRVAVRSGEPIVLGGMIRENEVTGSSGVPILGDIPVLGALFSTNTKGRDRTELLVLLTPRALEDDDQLRAASAELRQRMRSMSLDTLSLPRHIDRALPTAEQ
ncbi:MAG: type II secretion system secretin GspD [Giesbergeria sp.]